MQRPQDMKILKMFKPIAMGLFFTLFLAGFTGKEKYVELEKTTPGRYSSEFPENGAKLSLSNVVGQLAARTHGEILEVKKLSSGNYGLRLRIMNGAEKNSTLWVYYPANSPDIAFYGADKKLLTKQPATQQPHVETKAVRDTVQTITRSNKVVKSVGTPPCVECSVAPVAGVAVILRKGTRGMSKACSSLMNSQGVLGSTGQSIYSILSEPQYARYYTARNSLGGFCPKFNQLSNAQKLTAWTWFWTSLAQEESNCNPTLVHGTTYRDRHGRIRVLNPTEGYGLWAMEKDRNLRRSRGAACNNIGTAAGQARCSIDIMVKTQLARGLTAGVNQSSYWGPVRRGNSQLMPHMRRLNLCF